MYSGIFPRINRAAQPIDIQGNVIRKIHWHDPAPVLQLMGSPGTLWSLQIKNNHPYQMAFGLIFDQLEAPVQGDEVASGGKHLSVPLSPGGDESYGADVVSMAIVGGSIGVAVESKLWLALSLHETILYPIPVEPRTTPVLVPQWLPEPDPVSGNPIPRPDPSATDPVTGDPIVAQLVIELPPSPLKIVQMCYSVAGA